MQEPSPPVKTPPVHAFLILLAAWLFFLAIIAFYGMATLLLLPLLPLFLFGPVCLLSEVHQWAERTKDERR